MSKKEEPDHKYGYKFGNTDRGILLSVLVASLFLVTLVGGAALEAAGPALFGDTGVKGEDGVGTSPGAVVAASAIAIGVGLVLISPCFEIVLILIVLTIVSYVIYRLMSWLEEKCKSCNCCWKPKCWACCAGKLICWTIRITRWVAFIVTIVLAVITVITLIVCIGTTLVAIF